MRMVFRVLFLAWMSACATAGAPRTVLPADSRISIAFTRTAERLHLRVLVAEHCAADPCAEGKPVAGLSVEVRTPDGDRGLGRTTEDGGLDIALSQIDALFPSQSVDAKQRASLLVDGRIAAELPVGEIVQRHAVLQATNLECDDALADPELDRDYAQILLGRMLDLQMRGMADAELAECSSRLYARLRETPASWWSWPQQLLGRVQQLIADLRGTDDERAVPEGLADGDSVAASSFSWALEYLPATCKITVVGGAIAAAQVVGAGLPGIALAVVGASVGDDLSDWLVESCCQMASESLGAGSSPTCSSE